MADETGTPVLDVLSKMTADSIEASSLDAETLMLVRIAALVAVDAPPASYLMNLGAAGELGITDEQVRGVLVAVAPIVGTARVASAAGKIVRALGLALELAELEAEVEAQQA
jgi:4-carboxymuconolactone decarboxylase